MVSAGLLIVVLIFQGMLAFGVYNDAYQRGDDEGFWLLITLFLGVFGALLYLLQRPDERLPDDEQEHSASTVVLKLGGLYLGAIILGFVFAVLIAVILIHGTELPERQLNIINDTVFYTFVIGFPLLVHLYRKREWVKERLTV